MYAVWLGTWFSTGDAAEYEMVGKLAVLAVTMACVLAVLPLVHLLTHNPKLKALTVLYVPYSIGIWP